MTPDQLALISAEKKLADARQTLREVAVLAGDLEAERPYVRLIAQLIADKAWAGLKRTLTHICKAELEGALKEAKTNLQTIAWVARDELNLPLLALSLQEDVDEIDTALAPKEKP